MWARKLLRWVKRSLPSWCTQEEMRWPAGPDQTYSQQYKARLTWAVERRERMVWHPGHYPGSLAFLLLECFEWRCNAPWAVLSLQLWLPRNQFHPINFLVPSLFLLLSYPVHLLYFWFSLVPSLPLPLRLPWCISLKSSPAASQTLLGSRLEGVGQNFTLKHLCGASKLYWERKLLPPPVATWSNSAASETSPGCFSHQILPHKKKVTEVWLKGRWREGEENMFFWTIFFFSFSPWELVDPLLAQCFSPTTSCCNMERAERKFWATDGNISAIRRAWEDAQEHER